MSSTPKALPAEETLRLQALGALVDHAHGRSERGIHIDTVLLVARQHRNAGVPWTVLARALGISPATLRRWRIRDRPSKPTPPSTEPRRVPSPARVTPDDASRSATDSTDAAISQLASQFQHTNQTTSASSVTAVGSSRLETVASTPHRRRVLVLTGDPRPGRNTFDPEAARIRTALEGTSVRSVHVALISLGDIAAAVDRERAAILHLCAHRTAGGVALSLDGATCFVAPDDVAEAIERAHHVPRCTILSFCSSSEIAARLARRIPAVVAWPGQVEDEQATCYSGQFYWQIACGARLPAGAAEAAHAVATRWPGLEPPTLYGGWRDPVV